MMICAHRLCLVDRFLSLFPFACADQAVRKDLAYTGTCTSHPSWHILIFADLVYAERTV